MPSLKIAPVHHQPSLLSLPVSPFSPLSPIQPPKPQQKHTTPHHHLSASTPPPPTPLRWLWQCHVCRQKYPLGATRRCLEDGHLFCAGVTIARKRGSGSENVRAVVKRHVPCASEFDYQGWLGWGHWRAEQSERCEKGGKRDCWRCCNYPSNCRWGPHIGNMTGSSAVVASISDGAMRWPQVPLVISPREHRDQASGERKDQYATIQQPPTTFDGILESFELPRDK